MTKEKSLYGSIKVKSWRSEEKGKNLLGVQKNPFCPITIISRDIEGTIVNKRYGLPSGASQRIM